MSTSVSQLWKTMARRFEAILSRLSPEPARISILACVRQNRPFISAPVDRKRVHNVLVLLCISRAKYVVHVYVRNHVLRALWKRNNFVWGPKIDAKPRSRGIGYFLRRKHTPPTRRLHGIGFKPQDAVHLWFIQTYSAKSSWLILSSASIPSVHPFNRLHSTFSIQSSIRSSWI